jgi:hypothetical protein
MCFGKYASTPISWRYLIDESKASFAVVRFNEQTYQSGGVVAVVYGIEAAQKTLNDSCGIGFREYSARGTAGERIVSNGPRLGSGQQKKTARRTQGTFSVQGPPFGAIESHYSGSSSLPLSIELRHALPTPPTG